MGFLIALDLIISFLFCCLMGWGIGKFIFVALNDWTDFSSRNEHKVQIALMATIALLLFVLILIKF